MEIETVTVTEQAQPEVKEEKAAFTAEEVANLEPKEKEMALESGILKKEDIERPVDPLKTKLAEEKKEDDEPKHYTQNEKALYREMKQNLKRAQEAEEQLKRTGLFAIKGKDGLQKLKKVADLVEKIDNGEEVTTKELREVIGKIEDLNIPEPESESVIQYRQVKAQTVELEGKSLFADFDAITQVAMDNMTSEEGQKIVRAMNDPSVPAKKIAEMVADIARKYPSSIAKAEVSTPAKKAEKNLDKPRTSASISSSPNSRVVSINDLTVEDLAKMSQEEYEKVPNYIIRRLLKGL